MIRAYPPPPIDEIVRRIVENVHPRRIVLFGSRARGDFDADSDVDIMVEMETDLRPGDRRIQVASLFPDRWWAMDVLVYTPAEVAELRDNPFHGLSRILREGRVLYQQDPVGGQPKRVREEEPRVSAVRAWLAHAREDWHTVEICMQAKQPPYTSVCFHAQQAAEKYMKALLVARGVVPPRTHDLLQLNALSAKAGADLSDIDRECELLGQYAVEPRYPDMVAPRLVASAEEAKRAIIAARRVKIVIGPLLPVLP